MDLQPAAIVKGILHDLQDIEDESLLCKNKEEKEKLEFKRLLKKRENLRQKLSNRKKMLAGLSSSSDDDVADLANTTNLNDALAMKKHKLEELMLAYRLTGLSLTVINKSTVRLCFDTCYHGSFYEPYYVEIDFCEEVLKIKRHTLPVFIDIFEIAQSHLNSDISIFTRLLSEQLNAYVAKREEIESLEVILADHLLEDVQLSPSLDHIVLSIKGTDSVEYPLLFTLLYSDLADRFPTDVNIQLYQDEEETTKLHDVSSKYVELLKTKALTTALLDIITR